MTEPMTPQAPAFDEAASGDALDKKIPAASPPEAWAWRFGALWQHSQSAAALATLTTELASLKEEYGHMYKVVQSLDAEMCEVKRERDMHTGEHSCEIAKVTAERDRLRAANEALKARIHSDICSTNACVCERP